MGRSSALARLARRLAQRSGAQVESSLENSTLPIYNAAVSTRRMASSSTLRSFAVGERHGVVVWSSCCRSRAAASLRLCV